MLCLYLAQFRHSVLNGGGADDMAASQRSTISESVAASIDHRPIRPPHGPPLRPGPLSDGQVGPQRMRGRLLEETSQHVALVRWKGIVIGQQGGRRRVPRNDVPRRRLHQGRTARQCVEHALHGWCDQRRRGTPDRRWAMLRDEEQALTPVRLEFPILSLNPGLRQRCVAPDV